MREQAPSEAQVREALAQLQAWPEIARSPQLSRFLAYIVEKTLEGDEGSIKAYAIAVDVFGRPTSFDPQADPIVRVQARRLRTLLEQFAAEPGTKAAARILLPVGRYVPQFAPAHGPQLVRAPCPVEDARPLPKRRIALGALAAFALLGLALVGNWAAHSLADRAEADASLPQAPRVLVSSFANLTEDPVYDPLAAALTEQLRDALARFDDLAVIPDGGRDRPAREGDFVVSGVVRDTEAGLEAATLVSQHPAQPGGAQKPILWTHNSAIEQPIAVQDIPARAVALAVASRLGAFRGPLHEPGRSWLAQHQGSTLGGAYICRLQFALAEELHRAGDIVAARACLDEVLSNNPRDVASLAASSTLEAGVIAAQADAGEPPAALLSGPFARLEQAVARAPQNSFVREQEGSLLALMGRPDAATGALNEALRLNAANQTARARRAALAALSGRGDGGLGDAQQALSATPQPPPWFHLPQALDALRQKNFSEAMTLADLLTEGDSDIGELIGLAAAGASGDRQQAEARLATLMANERLRRNGVGARLAAIVTDPALLKILKDGLLSAGVSQAAIDGPF